MLLGCTGIENHPDGTGNINAIVNGNWGQINEMFNRANGLSASQSATHVTVTGGNLFIADDVGATILWVGGQSAVIASITSPTVAVVTTSTTVSSAQFQIYRADVVQTPFTALPRGLVKRARMLASDNMGIPVWSSSLNQFVMTPGPESVETLGTTGTITLDFATTANSILGQLTGNVTFASANLGSGQIKKAYILGKLIGSANLTFPVGWTFLGAAAPTTIAADKWAELALFSTGTTDAGVLAKYSVAP